MLYISIMNSQYIFHGGLWTNREKYAIPCGVLAAAFIFNFSAPYLFSPPGIIYRTVFGLVRAIRYERTWCNTLCTLGATISSLSLVNLVKPKVDKEACIDFDFNCLNCWRVCPMRIPLTSQSAIHGSRKAMMKCNKCLKCLAG